MFQRSLWQKFHQPYWNLWCHNIRKCSTLNEDKNEFDSRLLVKSVNEVKLLGYVGKSPKNFETTNNKYVTYFTMATARYYYDKSETRQKITSWHAIIVRKLALQNYVIKYVTKGARVYVSGYLDDFAVDLNDEATNKGAVHVVAEEVIFLKKPRLDQPENSPYFYGIDDKNRSY